MRQAVAEEAARILEHQGTRDYNLARRKAGSRLGMTDDRQLPSNNEIETALRARQSLFAADSQPQALRVRREAALAAMDFLREFEPRLAGAVLDGSADAHSPVCLHLFDDDVLALIERLATGGVEFEQRERRVRYASGHESAVPLFGFDADAVRFEVMLFERDGLRDAPLDRIHQRPQRRANRTEVLALLAAHSSCGA
ncbi:MAG: hypothetical protein ABIP49_07895 [Lysobacterales bacterium]